MFVATSPPNPPNCLPADTTITHNTQKRLQEAEASACAHPSSPPGDPKVISHDPTRLGTQGTFRSLGQAQFSKTFH